MSRIKALDELREYAEQCCPEYEAYDARMMEIADKIETEIAELFKVGGDLHEHVEQLKREKTEAVTIKVSLSGTIVI